MINPESKKLLQGMSKTQYGKALKDFLDEEVSDIGDITKVESWEETLGRKYALKLIKKLFSFLEEKTVASKSKSTYE